LGIGNLDFHAIFQSQELPFIAYLAAGFTVKRRLGEDEFDRLPLAGLFGLTAIDNQGRYGFGALRLLVAGKL
jgi:hypothetical protein